MIAQILRIYSIRCRPLAVVLFLRKDLLTHPLPVRWFPFRTIHRMNYGYWLEVDVRVGEEGEIYVHS